jgi:hypothetical protein
LRIESMVESGLECECMDGRKNHRSLQTIGR